MRRPTPSEPLTLNDYPCAACAGKRAVDGRPCPACLGRGVDVVTTCPREFVTADVWRLFTVAKWAKDGMWPERGEGGWLCQPQSLLDGVRACWDADAHFKAAVEAVE